MVKHKTVALSSNEERTLVFIKPDAVNRGFIGNIISRFEKKGIKIKELKMMRITPELAEKHYEEHIGKPFYPALKEFVISGPVVAMILEGREVVNVVRKMAGATDSAKAEPGTIRGDLSLSNSQNAIHASDSLKSAEREIKLFFG